MSRKALGFDESDSEEEIEEVQPSGRRPNQQRNKDIIAQSLRNQARLKDYEEEDPDIYQYDEVYDEIESQREIKKPKTQDGDEGSKYIGKLLEAKKKRNLDKLYVQDLKIQKEREFEGDEFKDKEIFVTSAYKEFQQERLKEQGEEETIGNDNAAFRQNIVHTTEDLTQKADSKPADHDLKDGLNAITKKPSIVTPPQPMQLKRAEETKPKSRLLPKLSDEVVQQYKERYLQRKSKEM